MVDLTCSQAVFGPWLASGGSVARQVARLAGDVAELRHENNSLRSEALIAASHHRNYDAQGEDCRSQPPTGSM